MNLNKVSIYELKEFLKKALSLFLSFSILSQIFLAGKLFASPGGPSQPEVQSFTPAGVTDMVDLFTGDFSYNIPLLDIDGYPINLNYRAGVTMDQEASWTGLGWNINAGSIQRNLRGLPDDFKGDVVIKEINMKPNITKGMTIGYGTEIFGKKFLNAHFGTMLTYNNYNGFGIENTINFNVAFNAGKSAKGPFSANLGIGVSSGSDRGLNLSPKAGLECRLMKLGKTDELGIGLSSGFSYNSREGLKAFTYGINANYKSHYKDKSSTYNSGYSRSLFDLGGHTYIPQIATPMMNYSCTGNFQIGGEYYGIHKNISTSAFYTKQSIFSNELSNPSYGSLFSEDGQNNPDALLDFNREKDGIFSDDMKALPLTNFTYDVFTVNGQGVTGSYRAFRNDIGNVSDPTTSSQSSSLSIGTEMGGGNLFHAGVNNTTTEINSNSGKWVDGNNALNLLSFKTSTGNPLYEKFYFKEANEKTVSTEPEFYAKYGGFNPSSIKLSKAGDFNVVTGTDFTEGNLTIPTKNFRNKREPRNQYFSFLTRGELAQSGLDNSNLQNLTSKAKNHHIGEITVTRNDGSKYVYGIAAYNTHTEETTFAVGSSKESIQKRGSDPLKGLVNYTPGLDNSLHNPMGLDNYFSNTIVPPYAHSYLLTAVLSDDYIDNDSKRGPSDGDAGNYTRFHYSKIEKYKWRVPFEKDAAHYNEGLRSDPHDDKGNYIYGEKEIWYLDTIETKNQIAIFSMENRKDGFPVLDKNGGIDKKAAPMKLLRKISLYSKPDLLKNKKNAVPITEVHFVYDYHLCPDFPANSGVEELNKEGENINKSKGKLTLKKLYFTHQQSQKGTRNQYEFQYSDTNPHYNIKSVDRWGNYKPNVPLKLNSWTILTNSDFPYCIQQKDSADLYAQAWNLTEIKQPTGGTLKIIYESDDYKYVQNKRAGQMFPIEDLTSENEYPPVSQNEPKFFGDDGERTKLWFKLKEGVTDINEYTREISQLYFKFLMRIKNDKYDYVSGYAAIEDKGTDGNYGWVKLKPVALDDDEEDINCNPILKTALQFARLNLSRYVWGIFENDTEQFDRDVLDKLLKSFFLSGIFEAIEGPNNYLFNKSFCRSAVLNKSYIRLNNPNQKKYGGGCRVKKIMINDEWDKMTSSQEEGYEYGQEYEYTLEGGASSGVASYEPFLGGDENPIHTPVRYKDENQWIPDDEFYQEEPFGESFYPSPIIGYSRITVKNLTRPGVVRHATGKTVHEFYTAKDFPVISRRTNLSDNFYREKTAFEFTLKSFYNTQSKDFVTASQGFSVELNDMHGKPKYVSIISEYNDTISTVEYKYKMNSWLNGSYQLNNSATVIHKNGFVDTMAQLGIFYEFISDMRESKSHTVSNDNQINGDVFILFGFPVPMIMFWPSKAEEQTRFRSAVTTKVIQRFGILEEIIKRDLGSFVSVKNMGYDAGTGEVLLTQTINNFDDPIYTFKIPAYWYYDGMGQASLTNGSYWDNVSISDGKFTIEDAQKYFSEGDELIIGRNTKGWVSDVNQRTVTLIDKTGNPVTSGKTTLKIISSGRNNQLGERIAIINCKTNPLMNISTNIYENVISANALEFSQGWRSYCECFSNSADDSKPSNPFLAGNKGIWRSKKGYSLLTDRTVSNYNNNTNIRKDGTLKSFTPPYQLKSGEWIKSENDWTPTVENTEINPTGNILENRNALNIYSASLFGYNQSLPVALAVNSRFHEAGFDGFEDYDFSKCKDNHFRIDLLGNNITDTESHSGKKCLRVTAEKPVEMPKQIEWCENVDCILQLTQTVNNSTGENLITIENGIPTYTFDWKILDGDLLVKVCETGDCVSYKPVNNNSTSLKFTVEVTDKNNCKGSINLSVPNP